MYSNPKEDIRLVLKQRIKEIEVLFPCTIAPFPTCDLNDLLTHPIHEEVQIRAKPFIGKNWQEITAKIWYEHGGFLHFATEKAFAYFLPSVLRGYYAERLDSRLSIGNKWDTIQFCMTSNFEDVNLYRKAIHAEHKEYSLDRICNILSHYNTSQLKVIRKWVDDLESSSDDILNREHQEHLMIYCLLDYVESKLTGKVGTK